MARILSDAEVTQYIANRQDLHNQLSELQADFKDLSDENLIDCREIMLNRINTCMELILETDEDNSSITVDITEIAYQLYIIDWKHSHVTLEMQRESLKKYYETNDNENYTYDEYLWDNGYNGSIYVCKEEFLHTEYMDEGYMKDLLDNESLFALYKRHVVTL